MTFLKTVKQTWFLSLVIGLFFLMMVLPLFSFEHYQVAQHTTSHLGAQGSPHAWVMNSAFILVGLGCMHQSFTKLRKMPLLLGLGCLFGLSFMLTGGLSTRPSHRRCQCDRLGGCHAFAVCESNRV